MVQLKILSCLICLLGLIGSGYGADKYTDENRPYEFGFTIEGEQHRHEKKDENGIIMGEFGFITADGVYHVTVYATDENGRFKILSMKNIRVKPYPTAGGARASGAAGETGTAGATAVAGGVKKGHSIPFPPAENAPVVQGPSPTKASSPQQPSKPLQINKQLPSPAKSCSHCSIPTTTTKAPPPQLTDIAVVSKDRPIAGSSVQTGTNNYQQNPSLLSTSGQNTFGQQETEIGKSVSQSYSGQQSNSPSPPGHNTHNSFGNVQDNYQHQDLSGYTKSSPTQSNSNYPQQNNNENLNVPQPNQYYPQNEDNNNRNKPQLGNNIPQSISQNRNAGDQSYTQGESNAYNNPQKEVNTNQYYPQQQLNYAQSGEPVAQPQGGQGPSKNLETPKETSRNPKQYNDITAPNVGTNQPQGFRSLIASQANQPVSNTPTLVAAQMQIVPKDTDIHHRNPGEEEGLPNGISKDHMTELLYTFNYTVGFHGHHEEGYTNGAKKGYYFVTGRNGIRTRVDYVADENGFRPKISQEVLDILSEDVPKPETEKDEKYGLKGYEFKWLYFPKEEGKQ